jgi:uncharacterized membrane protein YkgB
MKFLVGMLIKLGLLKSNLDYHLVRASMVITFVFFGYQKWFDYEAQTLLPFISNGPLLSWVYLVFGTTDATWLLGVVDWLCGGLLFAGFWNKKLGTLGSLGAVMLVIGMTTIIPFMPNGWALSAGGFPEMQVNFAFLMKDLVLLTASIYLLRQDVSRLSHSTRASFGSETAHSEADPSRSEVIHGH